MIVAVGVSMLLGTMRPRNRMEIRRSRYETGFMPDTAVGRDVVGTGGARYDIGLGREAV